jgi:predicted dehydrogenase
MTENPLRIAGVGAGYFSRFQYEAWNRLGMEVAAVCSRTAESAEAIARDFGVPHPFTDFAEMLDRVRPELVDIITPPETHLEYIKAAAGRSIPMICQKPFTRSLAEAVEAVKIADDAGVLLVVHENFRFQPWYAEIRQIVRSGTIGDPYQVTFCLRPGDGQGTGAYLNRQPYFQKMERFLVRETAIHLIDVFRYLFGEVTSVTAELSRLNPAIAGEMVMGRFLSGTMVRTGNRRSTMIGTTGVSAVIAFSTFNGMF